MEFITRLPLARLIFGSGVETYHPYDGLYLYGPYKKQVDYDEIVILYDENDGSLKKHVEKLKIHLEKGLARFFPRGFNFLFRSDPQIKISTQGVKYDIDPVITAESIYDSFSQNGFRGRFPLIIGEKTPRSHEYSIYFETKAKFVEEGIPSQYLTIQKLKDDNKYKWILYPLSIQIFVKMGGTPYALSNPVGLNYSSDTSLVMGVGLTTVRSDETNVKKYIGYVVLIGSRGEWIVFRPYTEEYDKNKIIKTFKALIINVLTEILEKMVGFSSHKLNLIIHYSGKDLSGGEERVLLETLDNINTARGIEIDPYIIKIHSNNEFIFSMKQSPCVSSRTGSQTGHLLVGSVIGVSRDLYLLFTTGCLEIKNKWRANTIGSNNPLLLSIKKLKNNMDSYKQSEFSLHLVNSVFQMCRLNYMSINNPVNREPISIKYSREIAYMVARLKGKIPDKLSNRLWFI